MIMAEDPEIFLHPKLQKVSGEILYRLSRSSQVIFSTHSPNLLANFNSRQIRQVVIGEDGYSQVCEKTDISAVLDDLGYSANDLMNVNFVFIVEGLLIQLFSNVLFPSQALSPQYRCRGFQADGWHNQVFAPNHDSPR